MPQKRRRSGDRDGSGGGKKASSTAESQSAGGAAARAASGAAAVVGAAASSAALDVALDFGVAMSGLEQQVVEAVAEADKQIDQIEKRVVAQAARAAQLLEDEFLATDFSEWMAHRSPASSSDGEERRRKLNKKTAL